MNPPRAIRARCCRGSLRLSASASLLQPLKDIFTEAVLDSAQLDMLARLQERFRKFPRQIWINGDKTTCLAVAIGNGHYVALCSDISSRRVEWRSIRHDQVTVRFSAPKNGK